MVKPRDRLRDCTGFQWDEGNATKNWGLHDVTQSECEQVFFNQPLIVQRDRAHSALESRFYALGRTDADRPVFVALTIRGALIRVICARDMTPDEQQRYER